MKYVYCIYKYDNYSRNSAELIAIMSSKKKVWNYIVANCIRYDKIFNQHIVKGQKIPVRAGCGWEYDQHILKKKMFDYIYPCATKHFSLYVKQMMINNTERTINNE